MQMVEFQPLVGGFRAYRALACDETEPHMVEGEFRAHWFPLIAVYNQ